MINLPSPKELEVLEAYKEPYCVSIYVPLLDRSGTANPNRIELKNLLRQAKLTLQASDISKEELSKTLKGAEDLLNDAEFWPQRSESLALFMHANFFRLYHIPDHRTLYSLAVGKGFNLQPLKNILQSNKEYLVLALGHKKVELYAGDRYRLLPVNLKDFPADMLDTLNIDEYLKSRELHEITASSYGKGSEAYHGQYNVSQVDKKMLEEFFRIIDRRLHKYLSNQGKPLVLAGVDYLLPIYRKVNTYYLLWPKSIYGSIKNEAPKVIQAKAWAAISE